MAHRLGIIGAGTMGHALLRGMLGAGVLEPSEVVVADLDEHRRDEARAQGCDAIDDASVAIAAGQCLLAVKPQSFPDLAEAIAPVQVPVVVVSIMAGLPSAVIRDALGEHVRVVRAMPNIPCKVGAGVTAIAIGAGASPDDAALAVSIFEAVGNTVLVDESLLHAVTAVSGSGPAWILRLVEAMQNAAEQAGLPADTAAVLVRETLTGTARLLGETGEPASVLRAEVTSPGGTTAAGMAVLDGSKWDERLVEAILVARDRAVELARTDSG